MGHAASVLVYSNSVLEKYVIMDTTEYELSRNEYSHFP